MVLSRVLLAIAPLLACLVAGAPSTLGPFVILDSGIFVGTISLTGTTNGFMGIPFVEPPTGDNRFNLPVPIAPYSGIYDATEFGPSCTQQDVTIPDLSGLPAEVIDYLVASIYNAVIPDSEDCLTINVWTPVGTTSSSNLPVLVWIFGGGFQLGSTSTYDGSIIVDESIALGQPVVLVSMNYRLSAFGFLASEQVKAEGVGNLGLQDQRQALRWVQQYITQFGGDPSKVTIWGESAGAISVALHLLTNNGDAEGLFRGAFMESGSPIPVGDISHGQPYYDALVSDTGCSASTDTLQCLREVPYQTLVNAMNESPNIFSYQSLNLAWLPRSDGVFLTAPPQYLVQQGSVADVPFVTGDCDDEGTIFALTLLNITTDDQYVAYMQSNYAPAASSEEIAEFSNQYPSDPADGSPFNTSDLNALTSQFKRLAAVQGDLVFEAPRRFFLQQRSGKQNTWSFLNKRLKSLPAIGSAHATDILNVWFDGDMTGYVIRFANNLDPNGDDAFNWPQYTNDAPQMLTFLDGLIPLEITEDTYRASALSFLTTLSLSYPL